MKPININAISTYDLIGQLTQSFVKIGGTAERDEEGAVWIDVNGELSLVENDEDNDFVVAIFDRVFDQLGYDLEELDAVQGFAYNIYKR